MSAGFQFHSYSLTSLKKNGTTGKTNLRTDTIHVSATTGSQPSIAKFQSFRDRFQPRETGHFMQPPKIEQPVSCATEPFDTSKEDAKEGLEDYDFALVEQDKENTNATDEAFSSINTLYSKQADRIAELQQLLREEKTIHSRTEKELVSAQQLIGTKEREIADLYGKCASSKKEEETKCVELHKTQKQLETTTKEKAALEASLNTCLEKNRQEKRNFITKITEINDNVIQMKTCYESTELGKRVGELMATLKKRDEEVKRLQADIDKLNSPMELDQPDHSNEEPSTEEKQVEAPKPPVTAQKQQEDEPELKTQSESGCDYTNEEVENLKIWLHEYQAIIGNCKRCSAAVAEL